MKFYGTGGTIVWDKENDKALCQFVDGELETKDKRIIDLLTKAGYRSDEVAETIEGNPKGQEVEAEQAEAKTEEVNDEGIDFEEMTYNELKSLAKAKGVTVGHKNKADLIIALKEGE